MSDLEDMNVILENLARNDVEKDSIQKEVEVD